MQLHKKTVYIREEDLELWAACPNKSLMVHNALAGAPYGEPKRVDKSKEVEMILEQKKALDKAPIPTENRVVGEFQDPISGKPIRSTRFDGPLCKIHGLPLDGRGKCLQKDCKNA